MEKPDNPIIGKWQQPAGQPYAGQWLEFNLDGTFQTVYSELGVTSSGTYIVSDDHIYLNQTQHSFCLLGKFEGRFRIDSSSLLLSLRNTFDKTPVDLSKARLYLKQ
ncbi:MAG: hypothetical protein ACYDH2_01865 [Anaerolineaceae bacterium]|nr:hypothetical protein [Anaerolineaceae bacterium]